MPFKLNPQDFLWNQKKTNSINLKLSVHATSLIEKINLSIPGSKSITNRAIVLCGMLNQSVTLTGFLFSEDTFYALKCLEILNFQINYNFKLKIVHIKPPTNFPKTDTSLNLGKAGTLARFFPAVLLNWNKTFASAPKINFNLFAHAQLEKRPLQNLLDALRNLNGVIKGNHLPIQITPSNLFGNCEIDGNISGQFLSGLILASFGSQSEIQILRNKNLVQPHYVDITIKMCEEFGCKIDKNQDKSEFTCHPKIEKKIDIISIEPDASTACYFLCLSYLHNINLVIENLGDNTLQPDYKLTSILIEMGAQIIIEKNRTEILKKNSPFQLNSLKKIDASHFSDQAITLGILALFGQEPLEIYGIEHIRHHESNRIFGLVNNLNNLGFCATETPDGFIVYPACKKFSQIDGIWDTFGDHRFAMSGLILSTFCPNLKILNPECVEKTAPHFFEAVQKLGFTLNYH